MDLISRTFIRDAWTTLRWKLPLLGFLTFASAILEGTTIAALLPLLSNFSGSSSGPADRISRMFSDALGFFGFAVTAQTIAVVIVGLIAVSAMTFLCQSYIATRSQAFYVASWQRRMFSTFLSADYDFFISRRTGDLIAAITNEPPRIWTRFSQLNMIFTALLFILVQIVVSLLVAPLVVALLLMFGASIGGRRGGLRDCDR